ncbi:MAG: AI-2E family transporter [Bacteroidales bacterium]|nr:AI-2E family transporter [Bacteroidales bacterium]
MNLENNVASSNGLKFWIISASLVILIAGLKSASQIVTLFLLAILITAISLAPFDWLKKKKFSESMAMLTILFSLWILTTGLVLLLGSSISNFIDTIPSYQAKVEQLWESISQYLVNYGFIDADVTAMDQINPTKILSLAGNVFSGFSNMLSNSFLILLVFIFMLLEVSSFKNKLVLISPESLNRVDKIVSSLKKYFGIKTVTSLLTGVLVSIGLAILGVDFPILWGALAFLLNFIPNIGSIIAAIPAILLAFLQLPPWVGISTIVLFFVINFVIGSVLEPKLMGKSLGLSSFVVFISLIIWGWILGTVGMLIATPLTITLKIIFDSKAETRNIGIMLGDSSAIKEIKKNENFEK